MEKEYHVYNVNILGRNYPVRCTPAEEEKLKVVEKNLSSQLNQYRLKYVQLDKQDCLSMALIEHLMDQYLSDNEDTEVKAQQSLDRIEAMLAPHLP